MVSRIVFGVCVGDHNRLAANVLPRLGGAELVATYNQAGIASAYNKIIRAVSASFLPYDALVLLHDDLEITDPDAAEKIGQAAREHHVTGVIGRDGAFDGILWWEGDGHMVGRQVTDTRPVQGPFRWGRADGLDGSCLILSYAAVRALRFDEGFDGFHGYDVDLCRQARKMWPVDESVWVTDLETHHHTTLGFKSPEVQASWQRAHERAQGKWRRETVPA
jgi:GT2 family glycosyltransferase